MTVIPVAGPESLGIDTQRLEELRTRVRREVDDGLLPSCQFALARDGQLAAFETVGAAGPKTRYVIFSATKAFVASAAWLLIGDGSLDVDRRVAAYIPEFPTNGKDVVTVEQAMLPTSRFPPAPLGHPAPGYPTQCSCRSTAPTRAPRGSPGEAASRPPRRSRSSTKRCSTIPTSSGTRTSSPTPPAAFVTRSPICWRWARPPTAPSASSSPVTTGMPTAAGSGTRSRRARSATTAPAARSPGPTPRPACPSVTSPTAAT